MTDRPTPLDMPARLRKDPMPVCHPPARVYVSGPYSSDPEACTRAAIDAADQVMSLGCAPLVPHLKHPWILQSDHSYEDWMTIDLAWLHVADVVLRLPGDSAGADREVEAARAVGIPVVHSLEELQAWTVNNV